MLLENNFGTKSRGIIRAPRCLCRYDASQHTHGGLERSRSAFDLTPRSRGDPKWPLRESPIIAWAWSSTQENGIQIDLEDPLRVAGTVFFLRLLFLGNGKVTKLTPSQAIKIVIPRAAFCGYRQSHSILIVSDWALRNCIHFEVANIWDIGIILG